VLNVDDRTRIDFVMQVGSVQENVTVEADAVQVQSDSEQRDHRSAGQRVLRAIIRRDG
jgi:hypothetical protein